MEQLHGFTPAIIKVFSSFFTNVAAAIFLTIPLSISIQELTNRLVSVIIYLFLAVTFEKN